MPYEWDIREYAVFMKQTNNTLTRAFVEILNCATAGQFAIT